MQCLSHTRLYLVRRIITTPSRFFPNCRQLLSPSYLSPHQAPHLQYLVAAYSSTALRSSPTSPTLPRRQHKPINSHRHVRYCSYRRNMCRQTGMGSDPTAVNIQQSRQVLPTDVKPLHYRLTLEPNFKTFEFDGEVCIE
jgi:aminopeptidase 2